MLYRTLARSPRNGRQRARQDAAWPGGQYRTDGQGGTVRQDLSHINGQATLETDKANYRALARRAGRRCLEHEGRMPALAQLGDAQLHRAGPRLPRPVAVAIALGDPLRIALAMG